jgi:hypothetical protein
MAFRVEISAQAERDAEAILEWLLSQHTGQTGIDWFLALDDAIRRAGRVIIPGVENLADVPPAAILRTIHRAVVAASPLAYRRASSRTSVSLAQ